MISAMFLLMLGLAEAAEKIPSVQELEAFAEEERRKRNLPLDCLAGACLGDKGDVQTPKVVAVAGQEMNRSLTVCGGQIVEIQVYQAWIEGPVENPWVMYDSGYFQDSEERVSFLLEELVKLGWEVPSAEDKTLDRGKNEKTEAKIWDMYNPEKQGRRLLLRSKVMSRIYDWEILAVRLALLSVHPDKDALCAPKRQQGL